MDYFIKLLPLPDIPYDIAEYLKPASKLRDEFAAWNFYQCLPLVAANTLGWTLYNPFEFSVLWKGGSKREDVIIESENADWVQSWFSYGTFTIFPHFLVQTSPGVNLLVRSVPNRFKHVVLTYDGLVETDWLKSSFTLNFRLMMPLVKLTFKVGEPLVQFVPYPRDFIEQFDAEIVSAGEDYDEHMKGYNEWASRRDKMVEDRDPPELDYMQGKDVDGSLFPDHKRTFKPAPFKHRE